MGPTAVLVRVALAVVFLVSGVAKLADREGTKQAVAGFGVPAALVSTTALALAPVELLVAALLVWTPSATAGLVAALALLAAFTAAVVVALASGRRPECHCFGRIGGADISLRTVARNAVLATLAAAGLYSLVTPEVDLSTAEAQAGTAGGLVLAGGVLLAEGVAGRAARRARDRQDAAAFEEGMAGGRPVRTAPPFRVPTLAGADTSLDELLAPGLPLLLVFLSPGCGPCRSLRPAVTWWAEVYAGRLTVAIVGGGGAGPNAAAYEDGVPSSLQVLLDDDNAILDAYGVIGTPAAVLVDPDRVIRGGVVAAGELLVRRLLAAGLAGTEPDTGHQQIEGVAASSLSLTSIPRPRQTVTSHQQPEQTVLVDEAVGASVSLNPIGGVVWSVIDGRSSLEEIVTDLAEVFDAQVDVVGQDVLKLVRSLGRSGMLEGVAAEQVSQDVDAVDQPEPAR